MSDRERRSMRLFFVSHKMNLLLREINTSQSRLQNGTKNIKHSRLSQTTATTTTYYDVYPASNTSVEVHFFVHLKNRNGTKVLLSYIYFYNITWSCSPVSVEKWCNVDALSSSINSQWCFRLFAPSILLSTANDVQQIL